MTELELRLLATALRWANDQPRRDRARALRVVVEVLEVMGRR